MDTRIEQTKPLGQGYVPPVESRDQSIGTSARIEPVANATDTSRNRPSTQAHTPPVLRDAAVRVETALNALHQMEDLVSSVSDSLHRHAATSSSPRADERLVRSAFATAQDIVEHARVDGQPLLGPGRLQRYTGSDPRSSAAVRSYAKNEAGYQQAKSNELPPLVRQALATARAFVSGSQGVLETLSELAERGPHSGESAARALQDVASTLGGLSALLAGARSKEILPQLNAGQGAGLPPDLRF